MLLSTAIHAQEYCVDDKSELLTSDSTVLTFYLDESYSTINVGDVTVLDFKTTNEQSCYSFNHDGFVGSTVVMDLQIESYAQEELLIATHSILKIKLDISGTRSMLENESIEEEFDIIHESNMLNNECYGLRFVGDSVVLEGSLYMDLPLCMVETGDGSVLQLCNVESCNYVYEPETYDDIKLKYFADDSIRSIAAKNIQDLDSDLHISKDGVIYSVVLVDIDDPYASPIRIKTSQGVKALRNLN